MAHIIIKMQSTESSYSYTTTKNPRKQEKLELLRYDPKLRKHVLFKESKKLK